MTTPERCSTCGSRTLGEEVVCAFCGTRLGADDRPDDLGVEGLSEWRWRQVWGMGWRAWALVIGLWYLVLVGLVVLLMARG